MPPLPTDPSFYLTPVALITLIAAIWQLRQNSVDLSKKKREIDQKIYETLILRQIGERIGYELNIAKILDIIIDSLTNLLSFSSASYLLISEDKSKLNLRIHLQEVVGPIFISTVKEYMLDALNKDGTKKYSASDFQETTTGTIVSEDAKDQVASLWIRPITINTRGVGILAIASKKPGLYKGSEMDVLSKILSQADRAVNNLEIIISSERSKVEAMVASMADGVLMFNKDFNLSVINPAAMKLLGFADNQKPTIFDIAKTLADKLDLRAKLDECVKTDRMVSFDNLVVGEKISQLLISPVKDNKQNLLGTVVLFHDLTVQKQLDRIREDFTAMMVHELRAPLTVVRGDTDTLIKDPQMAGQPTGQELLKTMNNSAASMLSLVNDLLDVAKIDAGQFQVFRRFGNLSKVISERVEFFSQLAKSRSIDLTTERLEENLEGEFDQERISQVLNNLLSNAIKFTPDGGKITVSAYRINSEKDISWRFKDQAVVIEKPSILVVVSDSGRGISQEKLPELFSKFKQLHPVEQEIGGTVGTGLGLVIARGIVESHGGKMFVESIVSEGSTFYFTITG